MGYRTCLLTLTAALLALATPGLRADETGTAVSKNPDPDTGSVDGEMTFFGIKATKDAPLTEAELRQRHEQRQADPYTSPNPGNFPFSAEKTSLTAPQRALLIELLRAVAANFPYGPQHVPSFQKQMAIALAMRLDPKASEAKLDDYHLQRMRDPKPLPGHEQRDVVAAKLWNAGFGLHRFSENEDDRTFARCLLDLARHFDPDNQTSIAASREIGNPAGMPARWEGVTEVLPYQTPKIAPALAAREPQTKEEPASFAFTSKTASLKILQPGGATAMMSVSATPLANIDNKKKKSGTQAFLLPEPPSQLLTPLAENAIQSGMSAIDQHFPGWRKTGDFLQFTLEAPITPDAERSAGLVGLILTQALARGVTTLDSNFAIAATLDSDGHPASRPDFSLILSNLDPATPQLIAIAPSQEAELLDMALLGNLEPLLTCQFIGVESATAALNLADTSARSASVTSALAQFTEIQQLTARMSPEQIITNAHVQDRLHSILLALPNHLSTTTLLKAGEGRLPGTLTKAGSMAQLKAIEQPIRELLQARNRPEPDEEDKAKNKNKTPPPPAVDRPNYATASDVFSDCEARIRHLRPMLDPDTQTHVIKLIETMDETLLCFRSDSAASQRKLAAMLKNLEPAQLLTSTKIEP